MPVRSRPEDTKIAQVVSQRPKMEITYLMETHSLGIQQDGSGFPRLERSLVIKPENLGTPRRMAGLLKPEEIFFAIRVRIQSSITLRGGKRLWIKNTDEVPWSSVFLIVRPENRVEVSLPKGMHEISRIETVYLGDCLGCVVVKKYGIEYALPYYRICYRGWRGDNPYGLENKPDVLVHLRTKK